MYKLYNGDCLEIMDRLIDEGIKVDCILTDPPYGTTACKWDTVIPFDEMWERLNNLIKPNGAIVLFGSEPFSSALRMSNIKCYKYDWVWVKNTGLGFQHSKNMPLKRHENILVFSRGSMGHRSLLGDKRMEYNPQGVIYSNEIGIINSKNHGRSLGTRPKQVGRKYKKAKNFPTSILEYKNDGKIHPTQKPVNLLEYLIKTYTNENETVLDFTMGSGSTGVACINTNRKFIGVELDNNYFDIASKRIEGAFFNAQNKEGAINEE